MALYKHAVFFQTSHHGNFDTLWGPGGIAPDSGIYRCEVCGYEIGLSKGHPLPTQNHHPHPPNARMIRWRLVAAANN